LIYYLRRQDVPFPDRRSDFAMRLVGTALIIAQDGRTLMTAWRNRRRRPEADPQRKLIAVKNIESWQAS